MGYPTRRVKVRRHNRNIRLHAMVVLGGYNVKCYREIIVADKDYFNAVYGKDAVGHWNKITMLEACAKKLGLENV
jgi:hypothetical protein